jgi:hypothetical protein
MMGMITARPKAFQPAAKMLVAVALAVGSVISGTALWNVAKIYTPITNTAMVTINAITIATLPERLLRNRFSGFIFNLSLLFTLSVFKFCS